MQFLEITPEEETASRKRRRKHDGFPAEVCAAGLLGAAAAAKVMFEYGSPSSDVVEFARVSFAGTCGAAFSAAIARLVRTRNPVLLPVAAAVGVIFVAGLVVSGPEPSQFATSGGATPTSQPVSVLPVASLPKESSTTIAITVAESSPATTEPLVASAGPVPPGDSTISVSETSTTAADNPSTTETPVTSVSTETSFLESYEERSGSSTDGTVSCTIDVQGTDIVPTTGCESRLEITTFGEPSSGPSAWQLPSSAELLLASHTPDGEWIRFRQQPDAAPVCVYELGDLTPQTAGTEEPTTPADRLRVIELRNAPSGTRLTLWADCDPILQQGFDATAGWVIVVR